MAWQGLIKEFKEYLPITEQTPDLTLFEGNTPLIKLEKLSRELEIDLYAKFEGLNPTGSFKDRGMVLAVSKAVESGAHTVICASTGNTSASAAAYAARAGLNAIVVLPEGKVAAGKISQAMMAGAKTVSIEGNFDDALKIVRKIAEENEGIELVNSLNPYRIECQKTAAFEIVNELKKAPDYLAIPVGNAANIAAYWKGFKEFNDKYDSGLPKMFGFEAEGSAAIVKGQVITNPETVGTAIRIGNPASWSKAEAARDESKGIIDSVTDDQILDAYKLVAETEGVFCEPGSAASLAGVIKSLANGALDKNSTVVTVLTGNGLKDPDTAMEVALEQAKKLPLDEAAIVNYIESLT